jgi:hypothetical protein
MSDIIAELTIILPSIWWSHVCERHSACKSPKQKFDMERFSLKSSVMWGYKNKTLNLVELPLLLAYESAKC